MKDDDIPGTSSGHTNVCERSSQTSTSNTNQHQKQILKNRKRRSSRSSSSLEVDHSVSMERAQCFPRIHYGLSTFFYVASLLAIVAFIAKLQYPEWQPLVKSSQVIELEAKVIDLEQQNNLLRAEFDILAKQVAFITGRNENNQRFKGKGDPSMKQQSMRRNPNRSPPGNGANNDNRNFERDFNVWPDDIDERPPFSCKQENGNCFHERPEAAIKKPFTESLPENNPQSDKTEKIDMNQGADADADANPNQIPPISQTNSFPNPENFDNQFSQQRNSKSNFESGHRNGKYSSRKHGERFDSRENFQRHDKPMKHHKPPDDHRFKKHPDQQYRHNHKSSGEDHFDSRERNGGNRYQKRNSNFENDKNRYREKPNMKNDNWYIARGDGREQARSGADIQNR